jgi:hypothetical protein
MPKLSQIATAPAPPISTDQIVGVGAGPTDYLYSISQLISAVGGGGGTQRSTNAVTSITIGSSDQIIILSNITAPATPFCALPQASTRLGNPVTIIDYSGNGLTHPMRFDAFAGDTIISPSFSGGSATQIFISTNFAKLVLLPFNDGVHSGWYAS